jgi:hypothetical protein
MPPQIVIQIAGDHPAPAGHHFFFIERFLHRHGQRVSFLEKKEIFLCT